MWFQGLMIITFAAAVIALLLGVFSAGKGSKFGTVLMAARVGLCLLLLIQILVYVAFIK